MSLSEHLPLLPTMNVVEMLQGEFQVSAEKLQTTQKEYQKYYCSATISKASVLHSLLCYC